MNPSDQSHDTPGDDHQIGDQNVERLLNNVYQPESLDPDFVSRVRQRAETEAARRRQVSRATAPGSAGAPRRAHWWLVGAAALALLLLAGYLATRVAPERPDYYVDGDFIWINGQAYRPAGQATPQKATNSRDPVNSRETVPRSSEQPATAVHLAAVNSAALRIGGAGLRPRSRPAAIAPASVSIGDTIATLRGQRRRFELPDGSILFVNEQATVQVQGDRRIAVDSGEIFVDVSPASEHDGAKFVVQTPHRAVTALGTKFAVNVTPSETDVAVAQGTVNVTGLAPALSAGQQLRWPNDAADTEPPITPLPRASHVLHWTRDLMAAAESPLVPGSKHRGGALVAIDPQGQQAKLSLREYHLDVHIEDGFARTTIDQTYFNHVNSRLEGTFYFPLPADASISRLAMYVNGKLMEGGMAERDHARNVFETIKHRSLDPALLEWVDGSTFKMRVFPLEGRQEKRIVLSYTQRLGNNYGRTEYRFPAGDDLDVVGDWSVRLHVANGEGLRWECTSHDLQATREQGNLTLTHSASDVTPHQDVVVALLDAASADGQDNGDEQTMRRARFSSVVHDGARYTMLRFRPELQATPRRPRRDWIFLFDADGSRDPLLARAQIDIIRTLLENAEQGDTFSVMTAATRVHLLAVQPWPVTDDNISAAIELLEQTQLIGALDLNKAFEACRDVAQTLDDPVVVHVGSAIPILGERASDRLLEQLPPDTPYVGVGVGRRWNRQFMKTAASQTGGYFTQINPDEVVGWRAFELLATLNSSRLLDLRVAVETDAEADADPLVFFNFNDSAAHGEEICAILRQEAEQAKINTVTVTGSLDGAPFRQTIPVGEVDTNAAYLPRIWAKVAIDDLIARGAVAHKAEIIALSKTMYVMSPFTSLLVLENDEMYEQYNVDRGRKDHWALYPCPAEIEVVHEPIFGPQLPNTQLPEIQPPNAGLPISDRISKPSREEILETLLLRPTASGNATTSRGFGGSRRGIRAVPDDGSVFLGGINRLYRTRSRNDRFGVPRHFNIANSQFGEDATSLMLMVTPRIIIQEEEEETFLWGFDNEGDGNRDAVWLIDLNDDGRPALADFDSLIELITSTIAPDTWDDVGGAGSIEAFPINLSLVIRQTQSVHGQGTFALDSLSTPVYPAREFIIPVISNDVTMVAAVQDATTSNDPFDNDPFGEPMPLSFPVEPQRSALRRPGMRYLQRGLAGFVPAAADTQLSKKLAKRTDFNYIGQPLEDVLEDIASRHDLPIVIDTNSLDDSGISTESRVTFSVDGISVSSGLALLTRAQGLTYFVADGAVLVTTPEGVSRNRLTHSNWHTETLLLIPRHRSTADARVASGPRRAPPLLNDSKFVDRVAKLAGSHWDEARKQPSLLYPAVVGQTDRQDPHLLLTYVPGIATTRSDTMAVLEEEADLDPRPKTGDIDPAARALIDAGRRDGWRQVTRLDDDGSELWRLTVDGQGRFRHDHKTDFGLTESVVCNGDSLWHLYPELGLGTSRKPSRFHRAELAWLVPWLVPPAEDLAIGADVRLIGPHTIAIAPHADDEDEGDASDDGAHDDPHEPQPYHRVHLVLSSAGRLTARDVVEMPSGKSVLRVDFDEDGTARWFDADHEQQHEARFSIEPAAAPDLNPPSSNLVVLPMPIRTRSHVYETVANRHTEQAASDEKRDALRTILADDAAARQKDPMNWSEEDALRLLAACQWQNFEEVRNVIGRRFFAKGDRRLGFYTLLAATGTRWDVDQPVELDDGTATPMSPLADHPKSLLARYLEKQVRTTPRETAADATLPDATSADDPADVDAPNHFISQLTEFEQLCLQWHPARSLPADAATRLQETDRAFEFIDRCDSPRFAFTLLRRVQRQFGGDQPQRRIAEMLLKLESRGMTSYVIKYELARAMASQKQKAQARQLFMELFRDSLDAGVLPLIDQTFRDALKGRDERFWAHEDSGKDFGGFMRGACAELIQRDRRDTAFALAWQCRQLGDNKLAGKLVDLALTGIPEHQRLATTLTALDYLIQIEDHRRAISLLRPLLASEPYSQSPELWRLAARVAHEGGMLAQSIYQLERAADLEYANLTDSYSVEQIRATYSQLATRYQELAKIVAADSLEASPLDLATRVVQAADRWRSLDTDVTAACRQAARLLTTLGQHDLAWDYMTTPLAAKPNESTAWLSLARTLRDEDNVALADRAYGTAWVTESTNASILWEHAQMLEHAGRLEDAHVLYKQIVDGDWQTRFRPIQGRAQRIMAK